MENECDFSRPEEVLPAFWVAMFNWELDSLKAIPRSKDAREMEEFWARTKETLAEIFATYCTPRKRVHSMEPAIGNPKYYNPKEESILKVTYPSSKKVYISTERKQGYEGRYLYVLVKQNDKWLIDNKKHFDAKNNIKRDIL